MAEDAKVVDIQTHQSQIVEEQAHERITQHLNAIEQYIISGDVRHIEQLADNTGGTLSLEYQEVMLTIGKGVPQEEMGRALALTIKDFTEDNASQTTEQNQLGESITRITSRGRVLEIITQPEAPNNTTYVLYHNNNTGETKEIPAIHFFTYEDPQAGLLVDEMTFTDCNPPDSTGPIPFPRNSA